MFNRILVVCTGNICRSPFGEAMLQQLCPDKIIHSAGTGALVDHMADKTAIKVAKQMNFDLSSHRARQLTEDMCRDYELILVMENHHRQYISQISPLALGKTMFYGQWLKNQTIQDPYRHSEEYFSLVFENIKQAARLWQEKL